MFLYGSIKGIVYSFTVICFMISEIAISKPRTYSFENQTVHDDIQVKISMYEYLGDDNKHRAKEIIFADQILLRDNKNPLVFTFQNLKEFASAGINITDVTAGRTEGQKTKSLSIMLNNAPASRNLRIVKTGIKKDKKTKRHTEHVYQIKKQY